MPPRRCRWTAVPVPNSRACGYAGSVLCARRRTHIQRSCMAIHDWCTDRHGSARKARHKQRPTSYSTGTITTTKGARRRSEAVVPCRERGLPQHNAEQHAEWALRALENLAVANRLVSCCILLVQALLGLALVVLLARPVSPKHTPAFVPHGRHTLRALNQFLVVVLRVQIPAPQHMGCSVRTTWSQRCGPPRCSSHQCPYPSSLSIQA